MTFLLIFDCYFCVYKTWAQVLSPWAVGLEGRPDSPLVSPAESPWRMSWWRGSGRSWRCRSPRPCCPGTAWCQTEKTVRPWEETKSHLVQNIWAASEDLWAVGHCAAQIDTRVCPEGDRLIHVFKNVKSLMLFGEDAVKMLNVNTFFTINIYVCSHIIFHIN